MRRRFSLGAILLSVLLSTANQSHANCLIQSLHAEAVAKTISVDIGAPKAPVAGAPIMVAWKRGAINSFMTTGVSLDTPLYILFSTPADIRVKGENLIALTKGAIAPHGITRSAGQSRVFVSLYRKVDSDSSGSFAITPYQAGETRIDWAIVSAGACGERVLASGARPLNLAPGRASIVLQDTFEKAAPVKRIRSLSGAYDLHVYKERFEVFEVSTGARLVSLTGTHPNFSPTSRFLAARREANSLFIVDLVTASIVAELGGNEFLAWARSDSFAFTGTTGFAMAQFVNTLADGRSIIEGGECHGCTAWNTLQAELNLDGGFFLVAGSFGLSGIHNIYRSNNPYGKNQESIPDISHYVRQQYSYEYLALPKMWKLGESLKLSNEISEISGDYGDMSRLPPEAQEQVQLARMQRKFLVNHKNLGTTIADISRKGGALSGTGRSPRAITSSGIVQTDSATYSDQVFEALGQHGVPTTQPPPLEAIVLRAGGLNNEAGKKKVLSELGGLPQAAQVLLKEDVDVLDSLEKKCRLQDATFNPHDKIDNEFVMFRADEVANLWRWQIGSDRYWLVQSLYFEGTGGFGYGCIILLREKGDAFATDITPAIESAEDLAKTMHDGDTLYARTFRASEEFIGVALEVRSRIALFDSQTAKRFGSIITAIDPSLLLTIRITEDRRHLIQLNSDGRFYVSKIDNGTQVLSGAFIDGEIIIMAEDGRYETSYEGAHSVQVRFAGVPGLYAFNQFEALLQRPGLAKAVLSGTDVKGRPASLPAPPTLTTQIRHAAKDGDYHLDYSAASLKGLSELRVYLDGRLLRTAFLHGRRETSKLDLTLQSGGRWLSVVAVDADGLVSMPSALKVPGPLRPVGVARVVSVGVDKYQDPKILALDSAKIDANNIVRALRTTESRAFREVETTVLLDADATAERVLRSVEQAAQATGPDDTLIVFFAGHGVDGREARQPEVGLVFTTHETRLSNLEGTSLKWESLAKAISVSKGRVIVLLDACQSGLAGKEAFVSNDAIVSALMTRTEAPIIVIAGSKGRQDSQEAPNGQGGRFTNAIVQTIQNRNKTDQKKSRLIDLHELFVDVKARVVRETKGEQTPWLARNRMVGEISLF